MRKKSIAKHRPGKLLRTKACHAKAKRRRRGKRLKRKGLTGGKENNQRFLLLIFGKRCKNVLPVRSLARSGGLLHGLPLNGLFFKCERKLQSAAECLNGIFSLIFSSKRLRSPNANNTTIQKVTNEDNKVN
jgi:hypothetical protein